MTELLEVVTSPWNLLWVLVVFGFAPGFCLRLIVLAYPRDDPRRKELIAELYAVPRMERPVWVAEQLEVALFEGLAHRMSAALHQLSSRGRTIRRTVRTVWISAAIILLLGLMSVAPVVLVGAHILWTAALAVGLSWTGTALARRRWRQHTARRPNSAE